MVEAAYSQKPEIIADFAAGDGALLKAAAKKWPTSRIIGLDINKIHVSTLKSFHFGWEVGRCDFLKVKSRHQCKVIRELEKNVSLVLLNPPFSYRGGMYSEFSSSSGSIRCSRAFAFVLTATDYLKENGEIIALLPSGCLSTEKDQAARKTLKQLGDYQIVSEHHFETFPGVHAKTIMLRFINSPNKPKRKYKPIIPNSEDSKFGCQLPKIFRGNIQMHTLNGNIGGKLTPLIHTTEMVATGLNITRRKTNTEKSCIMGPAVLLPRVGNPNKEKIHLWLHRKKIALSDCVLGIRCNSQKEAKGIKKAIQNNWNFIKNLYGGTCAPYITINALNRALLELKKFSDRE